MYKEFTKRFPLKVKVTKNIIEGANIMNIYDCIGTRALKKALNKKELEMLNDKVDWVTYFTILNIKDSKLTTITSHKEDGNAIDMMSIKEPCTIVFRVKE